MSQYQDEELGRPEGCWRNGTRISVWNNRTTDPFRCSVAPGKFPWYDGKRRVPFTVTFTTGFFRNLFVNGIKQPECQLARAADTCLFLPSFVLHFEKERENEIAASAFQNYIWRHFLNVCHTFDISRWSIEHNRRKVGNARSRINNSTFYNKASMTSSIAGKIPICGFVEGCWHLKKGRETPLTYIQVIAVANALVYCIRQQRDRLLIRKCWSGGRMIFLISVLSLESWSIGRWSRGLKRVKYWITFALLYYLDVLIKW